MKIIKVSPFDECPIYESQHFAFRLVEEADAGSLLSCYSDPKSAPIFNSDNCNSDFIYHTVEDVLKLIQFWIMEYNNRGYVRFSVLDKKINQAIGTIEIFSFDKTNESLGFLRLDLASKYETSTHLDDVFYMIDCYFKDDFEIDGIVTKAIPEATTRINTLTKKGYHPLKDSTITSYGDYHIKRWS